MITWYRLKYHVHRYVNLSVLPAVLSEEAFHHSTFSIGNERKICVCSRNQFPDNIHTIQVSHRGSLVALFAHKLLDHPAVAV